MTQKGTRLTDRVAVVTGAAGGIGSAIVRTFVGQSAKVAAVDIDGERGKRIADELTCEGAQVVFEQADVTKAQHMAELCDTVLTRFGRLDVVVHAAGISGRPLGDGPVTDCPEGTWEHVLRTNL